MRKLILQMNITIDGYVSGLHGELDWMVPETDQRQIDYLDGLTSRVGTIVLGAKMAEESVPYWQEIAGKGDESQEVQYARFFVATPKLVFSKSLRNLEGQNLSIKNGDLKEEINSLKRESGKDIIVYGGARFVAALIDNELIDELNLFIHPVVLGNGLSIFNNMRTFNLAMSERYDNGIILTKYLA